MLILQIAFGVLVASVLLAWWLSRYRPPRRISPMRPMGGFNSSKPSTSSVISDDSWHYTAVAHVDTSSHCDSSYSSHCDSSSSSDCGSSGGDFGGSCE